MELIVRWYLNDASIQGQFTDRANFESALRSLVVARAKNALVRQNLRSTRSLPNAFIAPGVDVRRALFEIRDKDLRSATFSWFDKNGPFIEDDLLEEVDNYFEYCDTEVTATGLGEATRRTKAGTSCATYSFVGGAIDYATSPLQVDHGLPEERYGRYDVANLWQPNDLLDQALAALPPARSWQSMLELARQRFPNLEIGDLATNPTLAREPFEASIRDRVLDQLRVLNEYVGGRTDEGAEGPTAREIVENYFTGERAWFTGESSTNQNAFAGEMTFKRMSGESYFAHWHGKVSRRFFRMHFEWPLHQDRKKLEIFYIGPKITKN